MKFCDVPTLICGACGVTVIEVNTALQVSVTLLLIAPIAAEILLEPPLRQVAFSVVVKLVKAATAGVPLSQEAFAVTS
jgi:hypothetical protein